MEPPARLQAALEAARPAAVEALAALARAHPAADHAEALLGPDRSVVVYARAADGADLAPGAVVFGGWGDAAKTDEDAADAVFDAFEAWWDEAGGSGWPFATFWLEDGDAARYNFQTGTYA